MLVNRYIGRTAFILYERSKISDALIILFIRTNFETDRIKVSGRGLLFKQVKVCFNIIIQLHLYYCGLYFIHLIGFVSVLEIVFVGQCEVRVCLDYVLFFFFFFRSSGIGCRFFKKIFFDFFGCLGYPVRGRARKKIDVFKELTPCFRTYELRGQGKESIQIQDKQTPHTVLQKPSPKMSTGPLIQCLT